MSDVDRSPTPLDVFEETVLTLDERDYDGHVLVVAKKEHQGRANSISRDSYMALMRERPDWFQRCFAGQAVVANPDSFGAQGEYANIAAFYDVPQLLVEVIGGGVVNMEFADAKRYVQAAIALFREGLVEDTNVNSIRNYMRVSEQAKLRAGLIGQGHE